MVKHGEKFDGQKDRVIGPKEACQTCSKKCSMLINQTEREEICNAFWDIEGWDMKTAYLSERVKQVPISRRRIRKETKSRKRRTRNNMIRYSLVKSAKKEVVVCQKFFLATLNISEGRVKYCLQHKRTETSAPAREG